MVTKQTATWGSEHFLPPDQALPEDSSGCSLQGTRTPFPLSVSLLLSGRENSRALGVGAITGIVIGVLLVLILLAGLGRFIFLHRYSGIPRCCSCPRLTLVLEEGHPILHFRPGSPGPPHFPMDILSRPQFLPHLVLTCGSFLNTILIYFVN